MTVDALSANFFGGVTLSTVLGPIGYIIDLILGLLCIALLGAGLFAIVGIVVYVSEKLDNSKLFSEYKNAKKGKYCSHIDFEE